MSVGGRYNMARTIDSVEHVSNVISSRHSRASVFTWKHVVVANIWWFKTSISSSFLGDLSQSFRAPIAVTVTPLVLPVTNTPGCPFFPLFCIRCLVTEVFPCSVHHFNIFLDHILPVNAWSSSISLFIRNPVHCLLFRSSGVFRALRCTWPNQQGRFSMIVFSSISCPVVSLPVSFSLCPFKLHSVFFFICTYVEGFQTFSVCLPDRPFLPRDAMLARY